MEGPYKSIFIMEGRKIHHKRMAKMELGEVDSEDFIKNLTWKQWKTSKLPDNASDYIKEEFISKLISQVRNFGTKIDFNRAVKNGMISFDAQVDWLLNNGAKYTKTGLKC